MTNKPGAKLSLRPALELGLLEPGVPQRVVVNGREVCLVLAAGKVCAFADGCPHEGVSLAEGWIEGRVIECAQHGSSFDLETGVAMSLPATNPLQTYDVEVKDGTVYVRTPDGWSWPDLGDLNVTPARRAGSATPASPDHWRQRLALLRATAAVAERDGLEQVQVIEVVRLASVSKRSFYEHFDSKERCFAELLRRSNLQLVRRLIGVAEENYPSSPHAQLVHTMLLEAATILARGGQLSRLMKISESIGGDVVAEERRSALTRLTAVFQAVIQRLPSQLPDGERSSTVRMLTWGTFDDALLDIVRNRDFDDGLGQLFGMWCRCLMIEAGS